jgi:autoinducer 2-degrading protein
VRQSASAPRLLYLRRAISRILSKVASKSKRLNQVFARGGEWREESTMIAIVGQRAALLCVAARNLLVRNFLASAFAAALLIIAPHPAARAQASDAIYGVIALDVPPGAASQGVALVRQYRDGAVKQAGNAGVTLLQEADWPNRFVIYEAWKDQAAYDANEKATQSHALRDKLKAIGAVPIDRRAYNVLAAGPSQPAGPDAVYLHLHLDVFPQGIEPTLAAAKAVAEAARKGDGNLRYDVVQSVKPPQSHTTFIAAWRDRKAFDAYESSAYGRQFRDTVGPLLGSPFDDRLYVPIN